MPIAALGDADRRQLERLGIPEAEVERQLDLFRRGRTYVRIVRPCTAGDGVRVIDEGSEADRLLGRHAEAAARGRFGLFVPASGAATRMFADLLRFDRSAAGPLRRTEVAARAAAGDGEARALDRFLERLADFPFHERLRRTMREAGEDLDRAAAGDGVPAVLEALLGPRGLACADRPKGLLEFHVYPDGSRTAFEEQLVEAAHYVRDAEDRCRLHFTVSREHRAGFESLFREVRPKCERAAGARFEVGFSIQKTATDTLAADAEGRPMRDEAGRLVFRPGGHGALIENLGDLDGDLVYVKNIDNVQPDRAKSLVGRWKRILGGYLVGLERRRAEILAALASPAASEAILAGALDFAASRLHIALNGRFDAGPAASRRAWLIERLHRPLRVCGVVRNTGEPGGGPFWVRGSDGEVSLQIVERAQLDPHDAEQQRAFASSTYFNPVDLVCALRDGRGRAYDLGRFVDPGTAIVTRKSHGGREVLALERPGLWNGAMAGWITVFVEVPLETFAPVKTVLDLLREEHQPRLE